MAKWRPQGITAAGFGLQGAWLPTEKDVAQTIYDLVSGKAIFDAPLSHEDAKLCVHSVIELQAALQTQTQLLKPRGSLKPLVMRLIQACKFFKANAGPDGANFIQDVAFFDRELTVFRQVFYRDINQMIDDHNVQI